jgi:hypothetical protein
MSRKTRREKRNAAAALPVQTDWLWSCPPGIPLGEIARRLGFTHEPRTEFSVRAWTDERRVRDDLYRAFVPDIPLSQLAPRVVWDALAEDACLDGGLIVLRDLPTEVPDAVQMLIDMFGGGGRRVQPGESLPGPRFALVLEGWTEATMRVRTRYTTRYTVQALGGTSSSSQP